ncbi:MAG TPA: lipoyl(octanoyl) transferase LipB [Anaerolineales bacterium]|nr:lipoyl(octanoyl) transferase LipB [Anaerolineales bacterium]
MVFKSRLENILPSVFILQENPPTFTIGHAGNSGNLLASAEELARRGIEMLEVSRGGDITYHGPGQIIASPLLYLGDIDLNANAYLHRLEDVLIELLAGYGIEAGKQSDQPGVWVGDQKIGSVGIAVRHGYTFHGLSLNVNLDLSPFALINPCGVPQMQVTSMQQLLNKPVPFDEVKALLKLGFAEIFGLEIEDQTWTNLQSKYGLSAEPTVKKE